MNFRASTLLLHASCLAFGCGQIFLCSSFQQVMEAAFDQIYDFYLPFVHTHICMHSFNLLSVSS